MPRRGAKATFFPDRSFGALLEGGGLPAEEMAALARWLPGGRVDRKRLDAREMVGAMRDFLATDPPPAEAGFAFERTTYWDRAEAAFEAAAAPNPLLAALRLHAGRCERLDEGRLRDWYFARVAGRAVPADMAAGCARPASPMPATSTARRSRPTSGGRGRAGAVEP